MMPYTDYTVKLGDLKRAIMKNPYNPNLNIDGYMRYLKYNTPSAQPDLQQTCNQLATDCISRQAAIDAVLKLTYADGAYGYTDAKELVDSLEALPSAQQWIPCSERLPIEREEVIVSCHDDSGDTPFDYTSCGWVTTDGEYWIVDNEINNHVIAWTPLPEPYKREDNETD